MTGADEAAGTAGGAAAFTAAGALLDGGMLAAAGAAVCGTLFARLGAAAGPGACLAAAVGAEAKCSLHVV